MQLLIVSQYFWPENFRVNDLATEMARRGHSVTVLTGLPNYPEGSVLPEFRRDPSRFSRFNDVEIVRVPIAPRGHGSARLVLNYLSFIVTAALFGVWRLRGKRFHAVFVFQPSPITSCLPALLLGRVKSAPVLLWVLDLWPETLSALGVVKSRWLLRAVGRLVSFIYSRCDLVLAQSHSFVGSIEKYLRDRERIRYLPGWAEPLFTSDVERAEAADEMRAHSDTFNVLFAGNIGDAQDFPSILDAADRLRNRTDIRWLILGDGRAAAWVASEINRRSLGDNVRMLGRYPIERMPSFFRDAGALLVSLKRDPVFAMTIPGKVQSYLAAGRPIVGMIDGEGARVIEESGAGLVCPSGDAEALAGCVERLAALSSEARAEMAARGREYARREFDRERLLTQLELWMREPPRKSHASRS